MNSQEKARRVVRFLKSRYKIGFHKSKPFEVLIWTILSQRTRDENTAVAAGRLLAKASNPQEVLELPTPELEKLIKVSGTYRQKARRLKEGCRVILDKHAGRVPRSRQELLALPGVGYKTADIVLSYGYGVPTIAVDTHVNRIPKRLGLVPWEVGVEEVRETLESLVQGKDRFAVNHGLVQFGREICKPIGPRCAECQLNRFCEYYENVFKRAR